MSTPVKQIARVEFEREKAERWAAELRHNHGHLYKSVRIYERTLRAAGVWSLVYVVVTTSEER